MKKLNLLLLLALVACGSGPTAARGEAGPEQNSAVQPASTGEGTFYREGLSGVDFSGLDAVAKERALRLLNAESCDCGCGMKIAQCRVEDKTCPRSPSLAAALVNAIRTGATDEQALVALKALRNASGDAGAAPAPVAQPVPVKQIAVEKSPFLGQAGAPITIVTFEDFQCPYCARAAPVLKKVVQANADVRLVYKHYTLPNHPRARPAAIAAVAAQRQNKFWEMHDLLFGNQGSLDDASLRRYAQTIGLDMAAFEKDLADPAVGTFVDAEGLEARRVGVSGTPNVFVNGVKSPAWDSATLQKLIETARSGGDLGQAAGVITAELTQRQQAQQAQARAQRPPDNAVYPIDVAGSPFKGPADAPVVLVAFSDYQ